jgi:hypothetical protein
MRYKPFAFMKNQAIPSFIGILDLYPSASRAYSVRKLKGDYTGNAFTVRRSSDGATQDIGFIEENLDTTSLTTFVGASNGFITTWYDQSGNGVNATQATEANQPQIVSSGTVLTAGTKSSLQAVPNQHLNFTALNDVTEYCQLIVGKKSSATNQRFTGFGRSVAGGMGLTHFSDSRIYFSWGSGSLLDFGTVNNTDYEVIIGSTTSTTTAIAARNGTDLTLSTTISTAINPTVDTIMRQSTQYSNAFYQEMILWEFGQSGSFAGIQDNINSYYSIY